MSRRRRLLTMWMGGGAPFLLRDDFTDTLAAGSVNGTLAGGIGTVAQRTRTVTDTESHLSLSNGQEVVDGGIAAPVYGDPGMWHGIFTRTAGRTLLINLDAAGNNVSFGWDINSDALIDGNGITLTGNFTIYEAGWGPAVGVTTLGADYQYAFVLRTTGCYYFIKGGLFTRWTLLWVSYIGSGANVRPSVQNYNTTYTGSFRRIPLALYLPPVLAYDTFTRANGAIGSSETSGPEAQSVNAYVWTGATWTIATNKAVNTPTLGAELASGTLAIGTWYSITATQANYFYTGCAIGDTFRATAATALDANNKVKAMTTAELFASVDVATADVLAGVAIVATARFQEGIVVNLDSAATPDDFIIAYLDKDIGAGTTRILLDECVNGVYTNKITVTNATYVSGARLVIVRDGTECRVLYNNIVVGTVQTMTANTNTKHGLFSTNVANTFDVFQVMPRGTSGEYSALNRFVKGG